jgi:hypothetical protein
MQTTIFKLDIHGNGDREVLAQMSGVETDWYRTAPEQWREPVRWTAQQLDTQHQRLLERWPPTCHVKIPGLGDVFFCHATPRNDTEIFTRLTPDDRLLPSSRVEVGRHDDCRMSFGGSIHVIPAKLSFHLG